MATAQHVSSFIQGAPPSELDAVIKSVRALLSDSDPSALEKSKAAFQKYHEDQLHCVKLPGGGSQYAIISEYTRLPSSDTDYFHSGSSTSFSFDHLTSTASNSKSYTSESPHDDMLSSLTKTLSTYFVEHYPPTSAGSSFAAVPNPHDEQEVVILISATKSSPANFLSGRWRATYTYDVSSKKLSGEIKVQVHYYEDGNVALETGMQVNPVTCANTSDIVRQIAKVEKQYQEELNRALVDMNEGSFRSLRRQLPVTRQKIEWEKVRGYGLSDNLKGSK